MNKKRWLKAFVQRLYLRGFSGLDDVIVAIAEDQYLCFHPEEPDRLVDKLIDQWGFHALSAHWRSCYMPKVT